MLYKSLKNVCLYEKEEFFLCGKSRKKLRRALRGIPESHLIEGSILVNIKAVHPIPLAKWIKRGLIIEHLDDCIGSNIGQFHYHLTGKGWCALYWSK